jgi:hypothetical protein
MGRARSTHGEKRNSYMILVGEPRGYTPIRGYRLRCEDNIKLDLRKKGWEWHGLVWHGIGTNGSLL